MSHLVKIDKETIIDLESIGMIRSYGSKTVILIQGVDKIIDKSFESFQQLMDDYGQRIFDESDEGVF